MSLQSDTHVCMHTHVQAHTHMHTHKCAHTYTNMHTYQLLQSFKNTVHTSRLVQQLTLTFTLKLWYFANPIYFSIVNHSLIARMPLLNDPYRNDTNFAQLQLKCHQIKSLFISFAHSSQNTEEHKLIATLCASLHIRISYNKLIF